MSLRVWTILLLLACLLVAGCGESSKTENTPTAVGATPTVVTTAAVTTAPGDDPTPEHLTFEAGETISAGGRAGIFFLDPKTGEAEGWVVPADGSYPFTFTLGGLSADGGKLVYACRESGTSGLQPCGGRAHDVWYLLDTKTGARTRLDAFTGDFVTISPDGGMLLGATAGGVAVAESDHPQDVRAVTLPGDAAADLAYTQAHWSPDSSQVALSAGMRTRTTSLINVDDLSAVALATSFGVGWSPDGERFTMGRQIDDSHSELVVMDRDGEELWSKPIAAGGAGGAWSADGSLLYAEEHEQPATPEGFGPLDRVIVLDAETGATEYRIHGGFCPIGWAGTSHTLLTSSYGFGQAVADLDAGSLRMIDEYPTPMPFDDDVAILFDGNNFRSYDLPTGGTALIAHTTVSPAWDPVHEPLFAGQRMVFTALHGGHGGCGEGNGPKDPPRPELLVGPFADDAPVTRGGVH